MEKRDFKALAATFKAYCINNNLTYEVRMGDIVTVAMTFKPGCKHSYTYAESTVNSAICKVPASGGSVWGTDGLSIGGAVGLQNGYMRLNVSGAKKLFVKALKS